MNKNIPLRNALAFLAIICQEDFDMWKKVMDIHPDYLLEKYNRFFNGDKDCSEWGIHPRLKERTFQEYMNKWVAE